MNSCLKLTRVFNLEEGGTLVKLTFLGFSQRKAVELNMDVLDFIDKYKDTLANQHNISVMVECQVDKSSNPVQ